jgi:hypothetical protein
MKAIITTAAMLLLSITASAQWVLERYKADPLLGTNETVYKIFVQGDFSFFIYSDDQFGIWTSDGIFNRERVRADVGQQVLVGLYDDNDKLVDKFKIWLDYDNDGRRLRTRDLGVMNNPVGQGKKAKKLYKHLNSGKGYARIVADRFGKSKYDIKIPQYKFPGKYIDK